MCICSDRLAVQDCEMHYMNAWLKRCVFNLDLNQESVSEPRIVQNILCIMHLRLNFFITFFYFFLLKVCTKSVFNYLRNWITSQCIDADRDQFLPDGANDSNRAMRLPRKCNVCLNHIFHTSWKILARVGNLHDTLLHKQISKELIGASDLTRLVESENGEHYYICICDAKNIPRLTWCKYSLHFWCAYHNKLHLCTHTHKSSSVYSTVRLLSCHVCSHQDRHWWIRSSDDRRPQSTYCLTLSEMLVHSSQDDMLFIQQIQPQSTYLYIHVVHHLFGDLNYASTWRYCHDAHRDRESWILMVPSLIIDALSRSS